MTSISSNCFKVSVHYALFLRVVCQDYYNALEVYQSARGLIESMAVGKKMWEIMEDRLGSNSNTAVVIISANTNDVGTIKSVNHEIYELLGYDRKMLLNQNITALMPALFTRTHSAAITKYFETNAVTTRKERLVFALHVLGYIVPCNTIC
jgi:PAS domain S-box-containing protein